MNKQFSLYLDLLRAIAAFTVVLHHLRWYEYSGGYLSWFQYGNEAVIVFFVLSGYVIGFVSESKESGLKGFLLKRVSRIWSVLIPALVLSIFVEFLIFTDFSTREIAHKFYIVKDTLLFLNENWTNKEGLNSNYVFWSLAFEFWYYIFFAALFIIRGKAGWALFILTIIFTGYKIILLFPIWLLGYIIFKSQNKKLLATKKQSFYGYFLSLILFLLIIIFCQDLKNEFSINYLPLGDARIFFYQYIIGLAFGVHLFFANHFFNRLEYSCLELIMKPIRFFSSISFAVYCFHTPIIYIVKFIWNYNQASIMQIIAALFLNFIIIIGVSSFVERYKKFWLSKEKLFRFFYF